MILAHKRPCGACPMRRASAAGWLGDASPEEFIDSVKGEVDMPCHVLLEWASMNENATVLEINRVCEWAEKAYPGIRPECIRARLVEWLDAGHLILGVVCKSPSGALGVGQKSGKFWWHAQEAVPRVLRDTGDDRFLSLVHGEILPAYRLKGTGKFHEVFRLIVSAEAAKGGVV